MIALAEKVKRREKLAVIADYLTRKFARLSFECIERYAAAMKFHAAAELFFIYAKADRGYARESLIKLHDCFRCWITPHFQACELEEITGLEVLELRRSMSERQLGVARQYSVLTWLKIFLGFCRTVLKISCLDPNEIRLPKRVAQPVEFLNQNEVAQLRAAIPTQGIVGLRARALVEVLLATGMRISEALSLNTEQIDFPAAEADIIGKGGKGRTVFFSETSIFWIGRYLKCRQDSNPALFVTTGALPRRLSRSDMPKLFRRLRNLSGITKKLTPHLLRHTFCTSLLNNGADITFIKALAGHQDIQTTARYYLGVDNKALKNVLARCRPFGWEAIDSSEEALAHSNHISEIARAPALPRDDQDPSNSGTSSPAVRDRESL